jgi:hypothetical protein
MEDITERPAEPGELCTCGRRAVIVYLGGKHGPTGYCGISDGGDRTGPCPFCGGERHEPGLGRCQRYRLRLEVDPAPIPLPESADVPPEVRRRYEQDAYWASDRDETGEEMERIQLEQEPHEHRQVVVAYQIKHGQRADGWWFVVEIPGREREEHGPYATEDAMLDDKIERMWELEQGIVES